MHFFIFFNIIQKYYFKIHLKKKFQKLLLLFVILYVIICYIYNTLI